MAKTTSQVSVTQGSGINLSMFTLTSGRYRETVVLGDADEAGESLLVELPAHDSADRGSPLKIGGKASASAFSAVSESDRVDAWFTLNGQQAVVSTFEPAAVYDGGRRSVQTASFSAALNGAGTTIVAAAASLKTKVLYITVTVTSWTANGSVWLRDGAGGSTLLNIDYFAGAAGVSGERAEVSCGGYIVCQTSVNTLLELHNQGNSTVVGSVVYYQAP